MIGRTSQASTIEQCIEKYIDQGMTDKSEIFTKVVDELNVPRPTVRRVARDLRSKLENYAKILKVTEAQKKQSPSKQ